VGPSRLILNQKFNTMSVDVEIYMNNIVKFFKDNPKDLLNLVPKSKEEEFYVKIREVALLNAEKGEDANLTQKQLTEICVVLNGKHPVIDKKIKGIFIKTKYGQICLN
jgi:hypothetical protein